MAEYIDRKALLESLQETEKKLSELYDTAGTQDVANSCYGQRIMLIECILRIKEQPKADVAPVRPELRKAVELLEANYERGQNSEFVRNPLAWALHQTWETYDRKCRQWRMKDG